MSDKYKNYTITLTLADGRKYNLPIAVPQGEKGEKGEDGHTPQIGVDYWTNADKKEIEAYIDKEIAEFDFVKVVSVLPEEGLPNRVYFVPKEEPATQDLFDEWCWLNRGTDKEPNWDWEFKGTKQIKVEMTEYVRFTDYATASKAGVVKVFAGSHGLNVTNGILILLPASNEEIENQKNIYKPITAGNYKHAVKVGITTNTETWTDEDKAKACDTIGAIPTPKANGEFSFVKLDRQGKNPTLMRISVVPVAWAAPTFDGNANLKTSTPKEDNDCVPKEYVDVLIAELRAEIEALKNG